MSFPPSHLPNNPLLPMGFPPNAVPPLPQFLPPIGSVPLVQGSLGPMGVTVPAGVASVSAPPIRNQNAGIISAPPVMLPSTNALIFPPPPPSLYKIPEQKKLNITTVFVGNITDKASDMLIRQLLSKCGSVHNWKRIQGPDGKVQGFGFCDYADPESAVRAIRLLHDFEIADKKLIVKVDAKAQTKIDEYKMGQEENEEMDNLMKEEDRVTKAHLAAVLREHEMELTRDPETKTINNKKHQLTKQVDPKQEDLSGLDMEDEKKMLIHREIDKFRDTYKKYDEEKEEEKRKKEEEYSRNKDKERRSRSKDRDERSRSSRRSRERDRKSESYSPPDSFSRMSTMGPSFERRKAQELRQKELAYQRRLRDWEAREKRKTKEYEREQEKEIRRKEEEESEKQKLKQFLQDYDDDKHDPKFYKGRSFEKRKMDRRKELERDAFEQEQERKELAELNQKLAEDQNANYDSRKRLNVESLKVDGHSDIARSNALLHDEESRSAKASAGGSSVSFGFAGMKISSGSENVNGSASASSSANTREKSSNSVQVKNEAKRKRLTVSEVFNANEDDDPNAQNGKKRRPPPNVLLEDNTDSNLSTGSNKQSNSQLSHDEKRKQIKSLIDQIPTNKNELFNYNFDWDLLDNTLMERRIRPWISKKIKDYIGEEEQTLLDFICKKLLTKSSAQSLLDDVAMVLDDEAQVFVVKLWRLLIYEIEAKKLGINK